MLNLKKIAKGVGGVEYLSLMKGRGAEGIQTFSSRERVCLELFSWRLHPLCLPWQFGINV